MILRILEHTPIWVWVLFCRMCRMEPAGLSVVEKWIKDRRSSWERKLDRLGDLLAAEELPEVDP
jgi:hypothetical protein